MGRDSPAVAMIGTRNRPDNQRRWEFNRNVAETVQPAPETDEKKSRALGSYVVWTFVAVMVYVLSSGPVMLLTSKRVVTTRAFNLVYKPVGWAYDRTPFHKPLGLYLDLWCPKVIDKNGGPIGKLVARPLA